MKLHLYMVFHDGLSCVLPMIIVRYRVTSIFYYTCFTLIYTLSNSIIVFMCVQINQNFDEIIINQDRPWAKICKSSSRCNIVEAT